MPRPQVVLTHGLGPCPLRALCPALAIRWVSLGTRFSSPSAPTSGSLATDHRVPTDWKQQPLDHRWAVAPGQVAAPSPHLQGQPSAILPSRPGGRCLCVDTSPQKGAEGSFSGWWLRGPWKAPGGMGHAWDTH